LLDNDIAISYIVLMKVVSYAAAARRDLRNLPNSVGDQIKAKLRRYAETGAGDTKALAGEDGIRLRVGDYRVIFTETANEINVRALRHRREVYRRRN
jgi:mRNA interferase RelE/StbE